MTFDLKAAIVSCNYRHNYCDDQILNCRLCQPINADHKCVTTIPVDVALYVVSFANPIYP